MRVFFFSPLLTSFQKERRRPSSKPSPARGRRLSAALLLILATPAQAAIVTSPGPQSVAVTVYRDPERSGGGALDLRWLRGFALVTETRTLDLPEGPATIRFEGVAGGIVPVSAIVTGLPQGLIEKNRDARLLSPAALAAGALGRRLTIRRTDRASGRVREEEAILRAGPDHGLIVETRDGVEALGCAGLAEKPVYEGVPEGLSARPTLSVETRSTAATRVTVTLSYLASEFDWAASYVATIAPDGKTLDLSAWLTLANGNAESFAAADTRVVAGTLNRKGDPAEPGSNDNAVSLRCWPMRSTSAGGTPIDMERPASEMVTSDIIVTAQRRAGSVMYAPMATSSMMAIQEELGDLKLYVVPERVTVAANAQKQVGLLDRKAVPFERIHLIEGPLDRSTPQPSRMVLRMKNARAKGLGLPLPSGRVAIFDEVRGARLLAAQSDLKDTAVDEEVELAVGSSAQVHSAVERDADGRLRLVVTNANPWPVTIETAFDIDDARVLRRSGAKLTLKNGRPLWIARVPANGSVSLGYRVVAKR